MKYVVTQPIGQGIIAKKISEKDLIKLYKKHNVTNADELWERNEIAINTKSELKEYYILKEITFK